jgi:plasmid stabilization system protein ParE
MKFEIIVQPLAEQDIRDAFDWYEDKRNGLGYDFLLHIDAGFELILRDPFAFPIEYKNTRKHLIKRFPFKIIYLIENDIVIILAVLHGKRDPNLLKSRK